MKLFEHRPLCRILTVFILGTLLFGGASFLALRVSFFSLLGAGIASLILMLCFQSKKRMFRGILFFVLALSLAAGEHYAYQRHLSMTVEPLAERALAVRVEVEEVSFTSKYASGFTGRLILADGASLNIPVAGEVAWLEEIKPGDVIEGTAHLYPLSPHQGVDAVYYEEGCFGFLGDFEDARVVDRFRSVSLTLRGWREGLSARIREAAGEEGGALLAALLLGDKSHLPGTVLRDFSRLGVSHMLALSGLHLSVITLSLDLGLKKLRLHRRLRAVIGILSTLFYMLLTGFSPSVSRAGIMLILYLACFLFGETHDGMTALFASVALLCFCKPYGIYELSLWLSAAATFGILVLSDWRVKKRDGLPPMPSLTRKRPKAFTLFVSFAKLMGNNIAVSCAATVATLPIVAFFFGEFSWISLLSNLVLSFPIVILIRLSFIAAVLGGALPFFSAALRFLCDGILSLIRWMADIPGLLISIHSPFHICVLLLATALVLGFLLWHPKGKKPVLATLLAAALLMGGAVVTEKMIQSQKTSADYLSHKNGGFVAIESGASFLLYDVSSATYAERCAALTHMQELGRTEIDHYILSHYSYRVESHLASIAADRRIGTLWLALPQTEKEDERYRSVIALAEELEISYRTFGEESVAFGSVTLHFLPSSTVYSSTQPVYGFHLDAPGRDLTFLSPAYHRSYAHDTAAEFLERSHILLLGGQGGAGGSVDFSAEMPLLETVIIASSEKAEIPPGGNLGSTDAEFLKDGAFYSFDLG